MGQVKEGQEPEGEIGRLFLKLRIAKDGGFVCCDWRIYLEIDQNRAKARVAILLGYTQRRRVVGCNNNMLLSPYYVVGVQHHLYSILQRMFEAGLWAPASAATKFAEAEDSRYSL